MRLIAALLILTWMAAGQNADVRPSFEVVSVKNVAIQAGQVPVTPSCTSSGLYHAPGRGVIASTLFAYNIQSLQLSGMPDWTRKSDAAFDIEGKAAGPVSESECRLMVQSMPADRFKLAIHRETKSFPALVLVVGKNGAKLVKKTPEDHGNVVQINGAPGHDGDKGWSMAQLAEFAQRHFPGSQVIDQTGIEGFFKIKFDYEIRPGLAPEDDFERAIERQLGLKLEDRKVPMEVIVVDHVERPVAN